MKHYSCDVCTLDFPTEKEPRYTIRIEVVPNQMTVELTEADLDQDQVGMMADMLDEIVQSEHDTVEIPALGAATQAAKMEFDLCPNCFKRFLSDPLGREQARRLHFSKN